MSTSDRLHSLLEGLPEPPPPDALWPRLLARRRQQVRRRRVVAGTASTGLVVALIAVLAGPHRLAAPAAAPTVNAPQRLASDGRDAQVRALDLALQVAYDRGASDSEVAPLWEARQALVAGIGSHRGNPADVNDI